MHYRLSDIIDISALQTLMDSLWQASGIPVGIVDVGGEVLVAAGWQDICTAFHRRHPDTERLCRESDAYLREHLSAHRQLPECGYVEYQCKNGMIDIGVPIVIEGEHLASLFLGQFFYESPDEEFFRLQARRHGFDEGSYLEALNRVPIFSQGKVRDFLDYHSRFVNLLTEMGVQKLRELKSQASLEEKDKRFRTFFQSSAAGMTIISPDGVIIEANPFICDYLGLSEEEVHGASIEALTHPGDREKTGRLYGELRSGKRDSIQYEKRYLRKDGSVVWGHASATPVYDAEGKLDYIVALVQDITSRKEAEQELAYREAFERLTASISTRFVELAPVEIDRGIDNALKMLAEFIDADRASLFRHSPCGEFFDCTHEWYAPGMVSQKDQKQGLRLRDLPWAAEHILNREILFVPRVDDLPVEAALEKELWGGFGLKSLVTVPVLAGGRVVASLGIDTVRSESFWGQQDLALLKTVGEIVGNALERQQADQILYESEERLALALKVSSDGVWDRNLATDEAVYSPRMFTMLGYEPGELDTSNETWADLVHPEDRERALSAIRCCMETGGALRSEFRMRARDGSYAHILCRGEIVEFDREGAPLRAIGTHMDITAAKRAEEELQRAHQQLNDIVEFLPDATFVIDRERRVVAWNRAIEEMTGVSKEELLGQGDFAYAVPFYGTRRPILIDLITNSDPEIEGQYDFVEQRGEAHFVETFVSSVFGGKGAYLWATAAPLYDREGNQVGAIESIRDISDHTRAEQSLRKALAEAEDARDKIDAILKSVADGLVVADLSGRVVLMNRAAEKLFGVSLSMAIYRPLAALLTDKGLGVQVASALNGEEGMAPVEWDLFDDQGKPSRVVQARTAPVQGMDGKRSGTITTFRDVTREREIDRMKSEFISTAAHELRTPLTSVKGFSELLIQNPGFDPKERTDFLSIIYEKSGVLEKIIDDLLDLSRVESGRVIYLEKEPCDLGTVVGQAVSQYQAEFTHYRFSTLLPDAPLTLSLDRGKIGQVMENLLSNAVKFSKQGSAIEIGCRRSPSGVRVWVEDEGAGMTPEQVERVFDKFYRADSSNTAVNGLGLGMTITRGIIESHGGAIEVESRPGEGSRFVFELPLQPPGESL